MGKRGEGTTLRRFKGGGVHRSFSSDGPEDGAVRWV